ncbi:DUF2062 domain-containing protein [Celerinatantimonas diazotrophica]|uniref:DUF2062 domain-containing protein n=1 Tax=Celerinatantimonas diazotrophica TaxID=412034 RepID=A0A4R1J7T3_9GAMM|nr:DUF2062 domain-containing protein [Celerinatantimonas diazotrophica]TCK46574.1 hypothetical protein EV690_3524 [Celerinatantimonas diazotrophica]CAG9296624.1 hypothetical protein CEDIAZO_01778 [Celerinatantimonas diazotrophica]
MPKRLLQRIMPDPEQLKANKNLRFLGRWLQDGNLWRLTRRSAAGAFAVGLFMAFVPLPSQMIMAAALAVLFRVNLPLSVALVWVSNPLTMPPLFYFCYRVGAYILQTPAEAFHFELTWQWVIETMSRIGPPFLLGCLVCGIFFSLVGYLSISQLWRYSTIRRYQNRRRR